MKCPVELSKEHNKKAICFAGNLDPSCEECKRASYATAEQTAMEKWNKEADGFNQWAELGKDEQNELIEQAVVNR